MGRTKVDVRASYHISLAWYSKDDGTLLVAVASGFVAVAYGWVLYALSSDVFWTCIKYIQRGNLIYTFIFNHIHEIIAKVSDKRRHDPQRHIFMS